MNIPGGIFQFGGFGSSSNVYLIEGELLVDTGTKSDFPAILEQMKMQGISPGKVKRVVCTHGHFDHIGGTEWFSQNTKALICVHEFDAEKLKSGIGSCADLFGSPPIKLEPDMLLEEGIEIKTPSYRFRVLHTPGHTRGSICLYEKNKRILISGDTLFSDGFGRTDLPSGNIDELKASLKKLAQLDVDALLPGHGPPRRGMPMFSASMFD
ncbi:MAG: MBL fold metallo-hydrolase [Candidatus Aenigmarchaeota archaeon]|nr:MBL fold metallo-hydrolase [Candidatus Aenigmarchaeota archaeon]